MAENLDHKAILAHAKKKTSATQLIRTWPAIAISKADIKGLADKTEEDVKLNYQDNDSLSLAAMASMRILNRKLAENSNAVLIRAQSDGVLMNLKAQFDEIYVMKDHEVITSFRINPELDRPFFSEWVEKHFPK